MPIWAVKTEIVGIDPALGEQHKQAQARLIADRKGIWGSAMINKLRIISFIVVGILAVSVPLFAHHGNAAYDATKTVTVKGTVTGFIWANPHVFIKLDGKDDSGNTVHWIVEGQNPVSMTQIGWTKDTFKPGDEVEIDAIPAKNGNPVAFLGSASPTAPRKRIVINGKQFQP